MNEWATKDVALPLLLLLGDAGSVRKSKVKGGTRSVYI